MWGRMWSSGRGSGSRSGGGNDPEREGCVRSDGARKPGARKWTNLFRETDEYDRLCGRTPPSAAGSFSGAGLLPVKREWSEEPEEIEELGRRGVVGPKDFVADVDVGAATIAERSLREEAERRRHHEELEDLVLQQAVAANLAAKEKDDEWRRIREDQREKYIDFGSSDEED